MPDDWVLPLVAHDQARRPFVGAEELLRRARIPVRVAERWRKQRWLVTTGLRRAVRENVN